MLAGSSSIFSQEAQAVSTSVQGLQSMKCFMLSVHGMSTLGLIGKRFSCMLYTKTYENILIFIIFSPQEGTSNMWPNVKVTSSNKFNKKIHDL